VLHYEEGLTLMANVSMAPSQFNGPLASNVPQIYWRHPFESIKSTGDDGQRFFWIDFGGEGGEQVRHFIIMHSYAFATCTVLTKIYIAQRICDSAGLTR
jgi:hypothetical protein